MTKTISDKKEKTWVLPAQLPFADLKAHDLEECVYWLLDAMGARDLEWRTGSNGAGAADGGRDLEALFYQPSPDGEMEAQRWWIECKGRGKTVEPEAVRNAVINASAKQGLASLVIVTNSTFSNPTRDWVSDWQSKNPSPKIRLWDKISLERFLSEQPTVVLRLFSGALSVDGRLQAARERFWQKLEYVPVNVLKEFWSERATLLVEPMERVALIANELAHGSLSDRPWGAYANAEEVWNSLQMLLSNLPYLVTRSDKAGVDQDPLAGTAAHLLMMALREQSITAIIGLIRHTITRDDEIFPKEVLDVLWEPIMNLLLSELQDVCSSDCDRFYTRDRRTLLIGRDPVEIYWQRFDKRGASGGSRSGWVGLENITAPCKVGFKIANGGSCPLFELEPQIGNLTALLKLTKRVLDFRVGY